MNKTFRNIIGISCPLLSVAGVIATGIMASIATYKSKDIIADQDMTVKTKVKKSLKNYAPTIAVGASTIAVIATGTIVGMKQEMALGAAVNAAEKAYAMYRKKSNEVFGPDAEKQIDAAAVKEYLSNSPEVFKRRLTDCDELCQADESTIIVFEPALCRFIETTASAVIFAELEANRCINCTGTFSLSEFYAILGAENTSFEYINIGWSPNMLVDNGFVWLEFHHDKLEVDGMDIYAIKYCVEPQPNYIDGAF